MSPTSFLAVVAALLQSAAAYQAPPLATCQRPSATAMRDSGSQRAGTTVMQQTIVGETGKTTAYIALGLSPGATQSDIKGRYRKLALKYHPDRNGPDPDGDKRRFQEVTEAYQTLTGRHESASPLRPTANGRPRSGARPNEIIVKIEVGWTPGSTQFVRHEGQMLSFVVPAGLEPGDKMRLEVAKPKGGSSAPPPAPPSTNYRYTGGRDGSSSQGRRAAAAAAAVRERIISVLDDNFGLRDHQHPPLKPLWSFGQTDGALRLVIKLPNGCAPNAWLRVEVPDGRLWRFRAPDEITGGTVQLSVPAKMNNRVRLGQWTTVGGGGGGHAHRPRRKWKGQLGAEGTTQRRNRWAPFARLRNRG